jgi:hypothetical protein
MSKRKAKQLRAKIATRRSNARPGRLSKPKTNTTSHDQSKAGSKQARVLAMLATPAGASIATIMQATGWQQHSVRGFLAGVVRKKLHRELTSEVVDGVRIYRTAAPERA